MTGIISEIQKIIKDFPCLDAPWEIYDELSKHKLNNYQKKEGVCVTNESTVYCGENCTIQPTVIINGNVILGDNVFIGAHSILRGNVFIGSGTTIGPYNDICRSIIASNTRISHRNDIFDSYVGSNCWLASNVSIHNVRIDEKEFSVSYKDKSRRFKNFGAIIEDGVKIGVWAKVMPGSVITKKIILGPCVISGNNIIKKLNYKP